MNVKETAVQLNHLELQDVYSRGTYKMIQLECIKMYEN